MLVTWHSIYCSFAVIQSWVKNVSLYMQVTGWSLDVILLQQKTITYKGINWSFFVNIAHKKIVTYTCKKYVGMMSYLSTSMGYL